MSAALLASHGGAEAWHATWRELLPIVEAAGFWDRVDKSAGPNACWLWTGSILRGYGQLSVGPRGAARRWRTHRLAWTLTHGPIADGMFICHRCDNPTCCNPAHLFAGTHADNMRDMRSKGRAATGARNAMVARPLRGESNGSALLTEAAVSEIRRRVGAGERQASVARDFGVSRSAVWRVVHNKGWVSA